MLFDVIHIESCSSDNIFWWIHFQIGPYNNVKNAIYMPGVVILIKFLSDHFDSQVWLDASDTCTCTIILLELIFYFAKQFLMLWNWNDTEQLWFLLLSFLNQNSYSRNLSWTVISAINSSRTFFNKRSNILAPKVATATLPFVFFCCWLFWWFFHFSSTRGKSRF